MFSFKDLIKNKNRPLVMGILNITPDSFSDGGEAFTVEDALEKLKILCNEGADVIDVGACSTAPGNVIVSEEEEIRRLNEFLPVVMKCSRVPVSVDTLRPGVARFCLEQGVQIVNDESGDFNTDMAQCVKDYGCGWVFMHTGGKTSAESNDYCNGVVSDVLGFFAEMRNKALDFSISKEQLCFDTGFGFSKKYEDNIELLSNMEWLKFKGIALLSASSRKRFIGTASGVENSSQRDAGTVAAHTAAIAGGADIIRVHDVFSAVQGARVADAIYRGKTNG